MSAHLRGPFTCERCGRRYRIETTAVYEDGTQLPDERRPAKILTQVCALCITREEIDQVEADPGIRSLE